MNTPEVMPTARTTPAPAVDEEVTGRAAPPHPVMQLGFAYALTFATVAVLAWLL